MFDALNRPTQTTDPYAQVVGYSYDPAGNRETITYPDDTTGAVWIAEGGTLTTDEGTWRGDSWGVVDLAGVSPWAEGVVPFNYGEGHYVGEGVYEGLEYHWYLNGSNALGSITGWIVSSE